MSNDDWLKNANWLPDIVKPSPYDDFWSARASLAAVRRIARERSAGPWSTLGCTLAHVCSRVGPHVKLPDTVGDFGSLNSLWALVGRSSGGKGVSVGASKRLLDLNDKVPTHEVGTGQGLDSVYVTVNKDGTHQTCDAAVLYVPEIDTMAAHAKQNSSTLLPTLRKLFMAEALGAHYADKEKRRRTEEHRYRAAVIIGVQPTKAGVILNDSEGGTPQRFLWMPVNDPDMDKPLAPTILTAAERWPRVWRRKDKLESFGQISIEEAPIGFLPDVIIDVCEQARKTTVEIRQREARLPLIGGEDTNLLDGHANFTRLKVAALLALLDGCRPEITDEDWELSAVVMEVSDQTRQVCLDAMADQNRKANVAKAYDEVERSTVVATETEKRVAQAVLRQLRRNQDKNDGWTAAGALRKSALSSDDRGYFDVAVNRLLNAGDIEADESTQYTKYRIR